MGRADRIVFLVLACAAYAYVIARAIMVPVFVDEAGAFHTNVLTGDFVPFVTQWDAGNHVVYSVLEQASYFLFGDSLLGLRIWSVLGFGLYAWYLWRCGPWFASRVVRWCAWAALLCVPFMVEFFSLARGYGLAMGFWAMTLYHLVGSVAQPSRRDLTAVLAGTALVMWTMLSTLIVCGLAIAVLVVFAVRGRSPLPRKPTTVRIVVAGVLPWSIALLYSLGLEAHGALYTGSKEGYASGTVQSLGRELLGAGDLQWPIIVSVLSVSTLGLLLLRNAAHRTVAAGAALALFTALLLGDAMALSLSHAWLGSNMPSDRIALYIVQPAVLIVALGIDIMAARWAWCGALAVLLLFLPWREVRRANVDHTTYWAEQAVPPLFYRLVDERQRVLDRPLIVGAQVFIAKATWPFGARELGLELNALDYVGFPQPMCDLLMIDSTTFEPPPGFRVIARAGSGRNNLMERIEPLRAHVLLDSAMAFPLSGDEFRMLWMSEACQYSGKDLLLECDMWIRTPRRLTKSLVFAFVEDADECKSIDKQVLIDHQRGAVEGGSFRTAILLPRIPLEAERIQFGLYDPEWRRFAMDSVRVCIREISP